MEIILLAAIVALIVVVLYLVAKVNSLKQPSADKSIELLQKQILELNKQVDTKLSETNKTLQEQLTASNQSSQQQFAISQKSIQEISKNSQDLIKGVTEKLIKLEETNTQIKGFAGQLQSLENILKNPKQRGVLGEYFLESVLKNVLPPKSYEMQYKFNNGEIVDAAIFVGDKIIPVDSKFSLENYNKIVNAKSKEEHDSLEKLFKRDLKNRIDETSKYIRPEERTMSFAFMFIPSEGIYYDLLINKVGTVKTNTHDLIEYAFKEKGVIITSPTSFLAYLQTVLQGLRALEIEEQAAEIRGNVEKLGRHLKAYDEYQQKLGRNLKTVVTSYNQSQNEFKKIDKDVMKITGVESMVDEQLVLDKPSNHE